MADGTIATSIKNAHGNVTKNTIGNKTVTNTYDADRQLTKTVDSVSGETTLTYDDKGKVTSVTAPDHSEAFTYDEQDNTLDSKTITVNGITHTYEYGYKPTADKSLDSISVDDTVVRPQSDALGRNTGIRRPLLVSLFPLQSPLSFGRSFRRAWLRIGLGIRRRR
ncbi:MAG: hypothetical protein IJZ03_07460 [Clostridia bacterium]|nr:hypothetical protein [Clostridia bacterium]